MNLITEYVETGDVPTAWYYRPISLNLLYPGPSPKALVGLLCVSAMAICQSADG